MSSQPQPERQLVVPAAWPEPEWEPSRHYLSTALGTAAVVVESVKPAESHPRITLRCDWCDLNGVVYTWSASFSHYDGGYHEQGRQLERKGDERWEKPAAAGARRRFDDFVATLAPQVGEWVEENYEEVAACRLRSLRLGGHYLSLDVHREADRLEEKIGQLAALEQELSVLEGTLTVRPGGRSRLSPLAASPASPLAAGDS